MSTDIRIIETKEQSSLANGRATPLLNKPLLLFMLAMILANIGGNMYGPLLPLYLRKLNANVAQIGLFFTLSQIIPLVLQILGGWISDSLGRLRSIAMGSIAGVFTYLGLILAPAWQWVLLSDGFSAITRSLIGPSFDAYIAEQSSEKNRARVFGIVQTIFMIVSVIGPPLGGWLVDQYGFKVMLICAGIMYFAATLIRAGMARAARNGREAHPQKLSWGGLKTNLSLMTGLFLAGGVLTWILITDGVRDSFFSLSFNLMPVYLEDFGRLSVQQIGWLNSFFGVGMMCMAIPAGWLADKKGERVGIALGFIIETVSLTLFITAQGFWVFAASWILAGLGAGLMSPAYQSLISKAVPEKLRGTAFGVLSTSLGIFSLPAPAVGAQLWERVGPRFPFAITALSSLLSIVPVWLKFKLPVAAEPQKEPETRV